MMLHLSKVSDSYSNLINIEGKILGLYADKKTGDYYLRAKTSGSENYILCRTNLFRVGLYLESRINLQELYHLSYDDFYIFQSKGSAEAKFIEIDNLEVPAELSQIEFANELYFLINKDARPELSSPRPYNSLSYSTINVHDEIQHLEISSGLWNFSNSDNKYLNLVSIEDEKINPYNYDYVRAYSKKLKKWIYARTNPVLLKNFLTSKITLAELLKGYIHEPYIIHSDSGYKLAGFDDEVRKIIGSVKFSERIHSTLPKKFKSNSLEQLKIYAGSSINGKGSLPSEFKRNKVVELEIDD